jgi:hypothetical protein
MTEIERRAQLDGLWPSQQSIRSLGLTNANKIFKDVMISYSPVSKRASAGEM